MFLFSRGQKSMMQSMAHLLIWGFLMYCKYLDELASLSLTSQHGIIITSHDKLSHYLSLLTNQLPIESNFITCLADNLNAEVIYIALLH
jgi:hypothetical protein